MRSTSGTSRDSPGHTERRVYVSAHYDSVNIGTQIAMNTTAGAKSPQDLPDFNHDADAPGANDNGSGTALTMELARVFAESGITFDATLVFVCWAGEEQGLIGSSAHAERLAREHVDVEAVFNNDIVGNSRAATASLIPRASRSIRWDPRIRCRGRWLDTSHGLPRSMCRRIASA